MQDRPVSSPFHPSHYPAPWPFIPFANPDPPILLQKRLPFHHLPETLYVHDPYNLLSVSPFLPDYSGVLPTEWLEKQPKVFKYKLCLAPSVREATSEARKKSEEEEQKKRHILRVHSGFSPTQAGSAQDVLAYEVALPTKSPPLTCVDEAHLYLSPTAELGRWHHSDVYKAELELPRDLFVEPTLCNTCVHEELEEIGALKRSGRWQSMLAEAGRRVPEGSNIDNSSDGGTNNEDYEMSVPLDRNEEFIIPQCTDSESKPSPQPPNLSPSGAGGGTPRAIRLDCPTHPVAVRK